MVLFMGGSAIEPSIYSYMHISVLKKNRSSIINNRTSSIIVAKLADSDRMLAVTKPFIGVAIHLSHK